MKLIEALLIKKGGIAVMDPNSANQMSMINIGKCQMNNIQIPDEKTGIPTNYYAYEIDRSIGNDSYDLLISKLQKTI